MSLALPEESPVSLLSCDYDGTQFYTSEPAPGGIDVNKGYEIAIEEHLGKTAAAQFSEDGHNHRSPAEIVQSVAPHLDVETLRKKTSKIIRTKLEILEGCIGQLLEDGTPWPRPSDGFVDLWHLIDEAKESGEAVGTAVLSNGHTSFEQKTFEMLGLNRPDIYLTDDVLQALALNIPYELQVKPSPMLIHLARQLWLYRLGLSHEGIKVSADQIKTVHIGDDPVKDGDMAKNANADFVLLNPCDSRASWQSVANSLNLGKLSIKEMARNAE